jgi:formylglycine-generating enzyme required for sulfatase activity
MQRCANHGKIIARDKCPWCGRFLCEGCLSDGYPQQTRECKNLADCVKYIKTKNSQGSEVSIESIGIEWVAVPDGRFRYFFADDQDVTVESPFLCSMTPITVAQFKLMCDEIGYKTYAESPSAIRRIGQYNKTSYKGHLRPYPTWMKPGAHEYTDASYVFELGQEPNHPVVCIGLRDAQMFCRWLSFRLGNNIRLPSRIEWLRACGIEDLESYKIELDQFAWYRANSMSNTHPVGMKLSNRYGVHDMLGNIWEYCQEKLNQPLNHNDIDYFSSCGTFITGTDDFYRAVCGGCFSSSESEVLRLLGSLSWRNENAGHYTVGFRVVAECRCV